MLIYVDMYITEIQMLQKLTVNKYTIVCFMSFLHKKEENVQKQKKLRLN